MYMTVKIYILLNETPCSLVDCYGTYADYRLDRFPVLALKWSQPKRSDECQSSSTAVPSIDGTTHDLHISSHGLQLFAIFWTVTCCDRAEFPLMFRRDLMPPSLWYNIGYSSIEQEVSTVIVTPTWFTLRL
jgi:hypothetical protein